MKLHYCLQLSPEWWAIRRGYPTASAFDRILTPTGKRSAQQKGYIAELVAELMELDGSGPSAFAGHGKIGTPAMQKGRDAEPEARAFYEMEHGRRVQQVGFAVSACGRFGCSPDGLVGDDGMLELKVPMGKTHAAYLMDGELPSEYRPQVHGQLVVSKRKWVDFMSYCPGLPHLTIRVTPDDYTSLLAEALDEFHDLYLKTLERFNGLHLHPMYRQAEPADPGPDAVTYAEEY